MGATPIFNLDSQKTKEYTNGKIAISLDSLNSLIRTNSENIKDCVMFPLMKPLNDQKKLEDE